MSHHRDFLKVKSESGSDDIHYSVYYKELPEEFRLFAENKLNETEENMERGLRKLKAVLKDDQKCSELDLIGILRWAKYDIKKAKKRLEKFLKIQKKTISLISNMDERKSRLVLDDLILDFLPYRDKDGRAILYSRPSFRFHLYGMEDLHPIFYAAIMYIYTFPLTTVCGISYIAECESESLFVFYPILKHFGSYIHSVKDFPFRYGRADIVNENFLVHYFYRAFRPLFSEKLAKRINFHGKSYTNLNEYYNPDILPVDLKGNLKPVTERMEFKEELLNFIEKLKSENEITMR